MKKFLLSFAFISFLPLCSARALEVEKIAHFSTSYVACDLLYKTLGCERYQLNEKKKYGKPHLGHRIMVAAFINFVGHVKETQDLSYDKKDILANALGSSLWLLTMQIRF